MNDNDKKIQVYMASDWDEYRKALDFVQDDDRVADVKEVGELETTNWFGEDMFAYIFVFSAPNTVMRELCDYVGVLSKAF